jgi:hypothetical protein
MPRVINIADARRGRRRLDALSAEDRDTLRLVAASKVMTIYQYAESLARRKKGSLKEYLRIKNIIVGHPEVRAILKARAAARANG